MRCRPRHHHNGGRQATLVGPPVALVRLHHDEGWQVVRVVTAQRVELTTHSCVSASRLLASLHVRGSQGPGLTRKCVTISAPCEALVYPNGRRR
jgi:hypothetical protein